MNEELIIEIIEMVESNMVGIMDKKTVAENLQTLLKEKRVVKNNVDLADVSGSFTETDLERAYDDGYQTEGEVTFDIENYR